MAARVGQVASPNSSLQPAARHLGFSEFNAVAGGPRRRSFIVRPNWSATMPTCTWWIDEPLVIASSNPSDEELARFRAQGFSVAVSLLEEDKQPPRYDRKSAALAGWSTYSIPIEEGGAPSLDQVCEFTARIRAVPEGTKVLVHCESGLGRSAFMGAAYWIAKGLTASEAIARVRQVGVEPDWKTEERENLLHKYEELQWDAGAKEQREPSA